MTWEQWLRNSAAPPSDTEDTKRARTENQIRTALRQYKPLQGKDYVVYAKGSYANNTNVRLNYDVDIAVEYRGYFYSDLCFELEGEPDSAVGLVPSDDPYTVNQFKKDVRGALESAFGTSAVEAGRIAYRIREKKTTLPADVVPCVEYRRYDRIVGGVPIYHTGSSIFPSKGGRIDNYPGAQLDNGNAKNNRTKRRYKRMVRALKRLQTQLVDAGALSKELPSYLIECLVYNVPDSNFGHVTYLADMRGVLATIFNETLPNGNWKEWEEVNGLKYLFRGGQDWTRADAHLLADAAWDELGLE